MTLFPHEMPLWKRVVDIIVSGCLLVILSPVLLLIGITVFIVSPGPVLFRQERVGYRGKPFTMWKFRTMKVDADQGVHQKQVAAEVCSDAPITKLDDYGDSRIIPFGNVLRQTGFDELPQLFNVLRGDMSLIGPRPDPVYTVQSYQPWHHRRLEAVPGITGLWQVMGKNKTTFNEMVHLDITYIRQCSFWLDLKVLLMTGPAIFRQIKEYMQRDR